jgi:ketosteroid isomerase-like protein
MSNVQTIQQIYEAFGRGDIPAIIDKLDQNVEWDTEIETPGVPWLTPRRGAANIPGFFEALAPLTITRFDPHTFFENGDKVFALIAIEGSSSLSGKPFNMPYEGHLWAFNSDGKVTRFQHVADTATHQAMAKAG